MARTFLKITDVRVELLRDMSYNNLRAEGIWHKSHNTRQTVSSQRWETWQRLWNKTAPKGYKLDDNPYVFVYEFENITKVV